MATLHVRNVPDSLYEALRRHAEENGRSIGAEAVQLLEQQLALTMARRPGRFGRRRRSGGTFTRFTEPARRTVAAAQDEARELGHDHVGTGHLLLGLLAVGEGPGFVALETLGVSREQARAVVEEEAPAAATEPPGRIPFGPDAKKALEMALREALHLRHEYIGTEHLLLGIVCAASGSGAEIVRRAEPDADAVRACVLRASAEAGGHWPFGLPRPPGPFFQQPQAFRVVELEGSSSEWEARLNEAGAQGFELVEVVDRRAIFRRD